MKDEKEIVFSNANEELVEQEHKTEISRRNFLKKTAYSAPALMIMGQLAKPTFAQADGVGSTTNGPSGPPTGWNP